MADVSIGNDPNVMERQILQQINSAVRPDMASDIAKKFARGIEITPADLEFRVNIGPNALFIADGIPIEMRPVGRAIGSLGITDTTTFDYVVYHSKENYFQISLHTPDGTPSYLTIYLSPEQQ